MKFYLGVTDNNWFNYLRNINPEDVNFWQPGGNVNFKLLTPGAPFLFKLKFPLNAIGGVGFSFEPYIFADFSAWDTFGERNGCASFTEFRRSILSYRKDQSSSNPQIGCIVLTNPVFFRREDWIETPADWGKSIVQGKGYDTGTEIGNFIWQKVEQLLERYLEPANAQSPNPFLLQDTEQPRYRTSILTKVRLGQGAFRVLVTDAYQRRCSITGEKTLPVLESAHIQPYAELGPHATSNGILLRSDIHKLFDNGYITITNDLKIEVSKRIREEFANGKEYYQYHGKELLVMPKHDFDRPVRKYIDWHNENVFRE